MSKSDTKKAPQAVRRKRRGGSARSGTGGTADPLDSMLDAALQYGRRGWPVFPCHPRSKAPLGKLVPDGFHNATTDLEIIQKWWGIEPHANIAAPTGRAIGAWVLDCDTKKGARGLETYDRLSSEPAVRNTLQQITGTGGRQLFFRLPGFDVRTFHQERTPAVGLDGCDIQGDGAYVMLPPSVHPDTGRRYSWDGLAPWYQQRILDAPPVLLQAIGKLTESTDSNRRQANPGGPIPEGQRNDAIFRLGCSLRARGLTEAAIQAALLEENRVRCQPPLPDDEVRRIAVSAARYEPGTAASGGLTATVRIDQPTLEDLNRLAIWQGRIAFAAIRRRGRGVEATTTTGRLIRWASAGDLNSFSKAQQCIASGAGVFVPTPAYGKVRTWWNEAASLLLALSEADATATGDPMVIEGQALLTENWDAMGRPQERPGLTMGDLMSMCRAYQRWAPSGGPEIVPLIFKAEGACWVHPGKLRIWLSTPRGMNRHYAMSEVLDFLTALDFHRAPDTTRSCTDGSTVKLTLWVGDTRWLENGAR